MQNMLNVLVHFVWATWNREPIIGESLERELYRVIHSTCLEMNCPVVALGGTRDHVHLLVALSNTVTMADLMERVKGNSSRFASKRTGEDGWFKWQGSYGAFSVSPHEKRKVISYIVNLKDHADGTLWENAEKTNSPVHRDAANHAGVAAS
jgi:REP element-mobilizing transposase RayT